jgi:hypothetical protein
MNRHIDNFVNNVQYLHRHEPLASRAACNEAAKQLQKWKSKPVTKEPIFANVHSSNSLFDILP